MKGMLNLPKMFSENEEKAAGQGKLRAEGFLDEATLSTPWAVRVLMVLSKKLKRGEFKGIEKIVRMNTKNPVILRQLEKDFYEQIKIVESLTNNTLVPWGEVGEQIGKVGLRLLWLKAIRSLISGFEPQGYIKRLWEDEKAFPWIKVENECQAKMKAKFRLAEDEFYVWRNKLVERNLRLSIWQAGRILGKQSLLETAVGQEAVQEGNIGLMKGADYWNCNRNVRFSTYVTPWVKTYIIRYLKENSNMIRLPYGYQEQIFRIKKICADENEKISLEEISLKADLSEDRIEWLMRDWQLASQTIAIVKSRSGTAGGERGIIWEEKLPGTSEPADKKIVEDDIARVGREAMDTRLSPKQRLCLKLRFGTHFMTLEKVTGTLGTTRERIRQIQNVALTRLRTKA